MLCQYRWWPWSGSRSGGAAASTSGQTNGDGSSSSSGSTTSSGSSTDPDSSQRPLRPLRGEGGSIFNLFRVLLPGALDKQQRTNQDGMTDAQLQAIQGYRSAHDYQQAAYQRRCQAGQDEAGHTLSRYPPHSFDTVVDTFGLCSHDNPVQVGSLPFHLLSCYPTGWACCQLLTKSRQCRRIGIAMNTCQCM